MINIHKDEENKLKWKSGKEHPQSAVITDLTITNARTVEFMSGMGTAGWAPPEQWLGQFYDRFKAYDPLRYDEEYNSPEDSFSFGRMMIFIFSNWSLAWKLSFSPRAQIERYYQGILRHMIHMI